MSMPKAAVNEDHALPPTEHKIRFAGQFRNKECPRFGEMEKLSTML